MASDDGRVAYEKFFVAVSASLAAQAYALTGNLEEAKDLTQEALSRAWHNWDTVSTHVSPEAWTRTVLHNLAVGRWRRLQVRRRHESAQVLASTSTLDGGTNADRLDLVRALRHLPIKQRRAIVLHDLAGLTAAEVAAEMGAKPETVRVWLHRGRLSLAIDLAWQTEEPHPTPEVTDRVRSRNP